MSRIKRAKPSPALLISLIALFVALGSGAYAASKVGTKDIKNGAVTGKKLAKNSVKSSKTKDGGLKGRDLKDGAITATKLGEIVEVSDSTTVDTLGLASISVPCPTGTRVLSGGFDTNSNPANQGLAAESRRVGNGWEVTAFGNAADGLLVGNTVTVYAYCLEDGS
jgi:hypothetical protein